MAESNGNTVNNMVAITIDDVRYEVPAGMNLVDAAKWAAGNDIPVFCHHPKMAAVGMCRVCLVELGSIQRDRETGEILRDEEGTPQVRWFPTLQTACTQTASEGLVVRTATKVVEEARASVLEFLLSSHPLDCPICDKGGECPLQNLTMRHGPGVSRMQFADKMLLNKHVPLGELIFLDEERCIQCARCVRFQDEIVGDDVLAFHERGRSLRIITNSVPGFDSYFSGNTTDICPVGALTTTDFRFSARPWELREVPSICPYDAAGSNISLSVRLDRDFGGRTLIKRVMPRQNEAVNEIWISDKTRFGHHFTRSEARCQQPQIRDDVADWATAIQRAADQNPRGRWRYRCPGRQRPEQRGPLGIARPAARGGRGGRRIGGPPGRLAAHAWRRRIAGAGRVGAGQQPRPARRGRRGAGHRLRPGGRSAHLALAAEAGGRARRAARRCQRARQPLG